MLICLGRTYLIDIEMSFGSGSAHLILQYFCAQVKLALLALQSLNACYPLRVVPMVLSMPAQILYVKLTPLSSRGPFQLSVPRCNGRISIPHHPHRVSTFRIGSISGAAHNKPVTQEGTHHIRHLGVMEQYLSAST